MTLPYVGEIRLFAADFAPDGWLSCDGQLLPVAQHRDLFAAIGTTYGGDGATAFALPDLRGRIPVHPGAGFALAQAGGTETVTLQLDDLPRHSHAVQASPDPAGSRSPLESVYGRAGAEAYAGEFTPVALSDAAITRSGGGRDHENVQPSLCVNFIIALRGLRAPSRAT